MSRVTGSVITVQRMSGPVLYIKARDRNGKQIKKRLGPLRAGKARRLPGTWTVKEAQDELRDFLTELGRSPTVPGRTSRSATRSPVGCTTSSMTASAARRPSGTTGSPRSIT